LRVSEIHPVLRVVSFVKSDYNECTVVMVHQYISIVNRQEKLNNERQ
jgi:hypothetical protein